MFAPTVFLKFFRLCVGGDAHIAPLGTIEFALELRKIGFICRVYVGIDPYEHYAGFSKKFRNVFSREIPEDGLLRRTNRDADFGDKFAGIVRQTVIDERDLARKAADGKMMRPEKGEKLFIGRARLRVASPEADAGAERLGQLVRLTVKTVLPVEQQKRAVVPGKLSGLQVLFRNADADLSQKDDGLSLRLLEPSDGGLHVKKAF